MDHVRADESAGTYTCLDDFEQLSSMDKSELRYYKCDRVGLTRHLDAFDEFKVDIERRSEEPPALKWSNALAMSASLFMKELEGCSLYADQLWRDGNEHGHLRRIATFTAHERYMIYPEGIQPTNAEEWAWSVLFDDRSDNHEIRDRLLDGDVYDQIGLACNCDPHWGQFCVLEIGQNVEWQPDYDGLISDEFADAWFPWDITDDDKPQNPENWRRDLAPAHGMTLPEFRLA